MVECVEQMVYKGYERVTNSRCVHCAGDVRLVGKSWSGPLGWRGMLVWNVGDGI